MVYETIEVKPVTPIIGAEISGIDLSRPLGNQQFQELHDALMAHQVVFFRDQKLTLDEHKTFGRLFGELVYTRIPRDRMGIRRFCRSTPMPIQNASRGSAGIPTYPAIRNRRWAPSSI